MGTPMSGHCRSSRGGFGEFQTTMILFRYGKPYSRLNEFISTWKPTGKLLTILGVCNVNSPPKNKFSPVLSHKSTLQLWIVPVDDSLLDFPRILFPLHLSLYLLVWIPWQNQWTWHRTEEPDRMAAEGKAKKDLPKHSKLRNPVVKKWAKKISWNVVKLSNPK